MTIPYTPKDLALDALAIALICAPEPFTTPIGISLLCRKRGSGQQHAPAHPFKEFPDYYYRVDNIRGREITWEVRTIYTGQLPHHSPNRPPVQIKPREEFILSRKTGEKTAQARPAADLPPGVKVHHTIVRPPRETRSAGQPFIPGETVHHTIRQVPQSLPAVNKKGAEISIHHTIENSPGHIRHAGGGTPTSRPPQVIHHTVRQSPAARGGNPAGVVKPVNIKQHHEINTKPTIERPIVPPPPRRRPV